MATVSAPAPMPSPAPIVSAYVEVANRSSSAPRKLAIVEREALADLASLIRNVRFDMSRPAPVDGYPRFSEEYVQELGMSVLEVANTNYDICIRATGTA